MSSGNSRFNRKKKNSGGSHRGSQGFHFQQAEDTGDSDDRWCHIENNEAKVLAAMKQFKYFGADNWPDHMKLHTGQMEYLSKWLVDNGKISKMPDVKTWENLSFIPK